MGKGQFAISPLAAPRFTLSFFVTNGLSIGYFIDELS
jgi:hypothetical protein